MGNRSASEKHAVDESTREDVEAPKKPRRRQGSIAAIYSSWGGHDCLFFFRWAAAEIGHRAQAIEPQAETIQTGKRPLPFWDHGLGDLPGLKFRIARIEEKLRQGAEGSDAWLRLHGELLTLQRVVAGTGDNSGAARPGSMGGTRVRTNSDRFTEDNLKAAKRYGRVRAGMAALERTSPESYEVLLAAFLPRRLAPEIERQWRQLSWLAYQTARIQRAHAVSLEKEPALTLETFVLRKIERGDAVVKLAMEDAETATLDAIRAYEGVAEPPKEILDALAEQARPKTRRPKLDPGAPLIPEFE